MAYRNLISQDCSSKTEVFCRMRDFICRRAGTYDYSTTGIGWTIHDSSYAVDEDNPQSGDYFVIKSIGEGGLDVLYFKIAWQSSTYISIEGYLTWDITSHTGANVYKGSTNILNIIDTSIDFNLYIYGDLDCVYVVCSIITSPTDYRLMSFGKFNKPYDFLSGDTVTSVGSVSSGSDINIVVDSIPITWEIGREIFLWTTTNVLATSKVEKTTIKNIVGNTITCDIINSYTGNFRLSEYNGYFCSYSANFSAGVFLIGNSGVLSSAVQGNIFNAALSSADNSPNIYENRFIIGPLFLNGAYGLMGSYKHFFSVGTQAGLFLFDILIDMEQNEYRYFKVYSNVYIAIREV